MPPLPKTRLIVRDPNDMRKSASDDQMMQNPHIENIAVEEQNKDREEEQEEIQEKKSEKEKEE